MVASKEPIDWNWERDKEKAAISKAVVLSETEKEAAYRRIDEDYAERASQWVREKQEARGVTKREENEIDQAARYQVLQNQSEIDTKALADSFARNHKEKFETIRRAEERQREIYEIAKEPKHNSGLEAEIQNTNPHSSMPFSEENRVVTNDEEAHHSLGNARSRGTSSKVHIHYVTVRPTDVQNELPIVATPLKHAIESALFQVEKYRNEVSQNNHLCAEHSEIHKQLLQMLDGLRDVLTRLHYAIPENVETVSTEDAEKVAGYMERLKNQGAVELEKYFSPESVMEGMVPTGIVLAFAGVGSFFGPLGSVAGGALGGIFTKNAKPNDTLNNVSKKLNSSDSDPNADNSSTGN